MIDAEDVNYAVERCIAEAETEVKEIYNLAVSRHGTTVSLAPVLRSLFSFSPARYAIGSRGIDHGESGRGSPTRASARWVSLPVSNANPSAIRPFTGPAQPSLSAPMPQGVAETLT